MAFINIEIDSADGIGQLNGLLQASGNPQEGVQALLNYLNKVACGAVDGNLAIAVRSTSASVSASGGGSSVTYLLK